MTTPEPPRNVVAHYPDGRCVPLELAYDGTDPDGLARWVNVTPLGSWPCRVMVDLLPAHTTIVIEGSDT